MFKDDINLLKSKILIVDDTQDNVDLIEVLLDEEGYENILTAESASECYQILEENNIDLIIMDIMMPDIDGLEACRTIKSNTKFKEIPIIIATAKTDEETLKEGFESGASDYVRKPIVNEIELLIRVKNSLKFKCESDLRELKEKELELLNSQLEERIKAEVVKNREKEQIMFQQSRQASMGEMIGNIAHQWRQPLNTLAILIQDIQDAQQFNELTDNYLNDSVKKGMSLIIHMSDTIDDFRNFFKPNKMKSQFKIKDILEKSITFVEASFNAKNIKLKCITGCECKKSNDIELFGYPNEYSQVIINIFKNAEDVLVKKNIINPKIFLNLYRKDNNSFLEISDNAGGIKEDIIDKVFDPYFTTKGKQQGTGIGLYMSKAIIEKNMNGKLIVENTDEGAKFIISVPLAKGN